MNARGLINFTQEEKVNMELKFFGQDQHSSFERTYGWAWLLKLQEELTQGAKFHPQGDRFATWARTLRPLSDHLAASLKAFLPKLVYPIREGEHKNSAFALILAHEYAIGKNGPRSFSFTQPTALKRYKS